MDNTDPYRASGAPLAPAPRKLDIDSAGKGRRFLNYLIDTVTYFIVLAVMGGVVGLLGREAAIAWLEGMDPLTAWGLNLSIMLAYYTLMEGALGFTVGKLLTNTRVVDEYGRRPGFARALGRSVARL